MSFIKKLFHRGHIETVVCIDISARRVAGALVSYVDCELPSVIYTRVFPVEIQAGEEPSVAMLRALDLLTSTLKSEGIPALLRAGGKRSVAAVIVSIDAPWQDTIVHVEKIAPEKSFVFTKRVVAEAVTKVSPAAAGKIYTDASVVGTVLNGYEIHDPYGKRANHADVIILTSLIDEPLAKAIRTSVHGLTHTKRVVLIAGTSLRYQAMRVAFPHEHHALILDATGPLPEVALMRRSLLVAVSDTPKSLSTPGGVTPADLMRCFADLAKQYPLPRTIFLLARFDEMEAMKKTLDAVTFSSFWLSDHPPKIIPLLPSHMTGLVQQTTTAAPDLPLLLMAVYYRYLEKR